MAMKVTLRTKNGNEVASQDLAGMSAYPDIIVHESAPYILKRIMPDKQSAFYYEAVSFDLPTQGA